MKIQSLLGREIHDSRGEPTLQAMLFLDDGRHVTASVPSGASRSAFEAYELRDGGQRLLGRGVTRAVELLEQEIAPVFSNKEPDVVTMDSIMIGMDDSTDKSYLGANTMLAASCAVLKAQALAYDMELYQLIAHLCGLDQVTLPHPMFNMINGGAHADNALHVQEFLIVPIGLGSFRETMQAGATFFYYLRQVLQEHKKTTAVGDEGGFALDCKSEQEVFEYLMRAKERAEKQIPANYVIGLDVAASQFYTAKTDTYTWYTTKKSSQEMLEMYSKWIEKYPIFSIEDGLSEQDQDGWQMMMATLGKTIQIVGDDIFATSPERIWHGIENSLANAAIIKPNQIGTVTETLQAIGLCKEYDLNAIVSHRSGETNDTFIADLAFGTNVGALKAGGLSRGERLAKYNHLLGIEDMLALSVLESQ